MGLRGPFRASPFVFSEELSSGGSPLIGPCALNLRKIRLNLPKDHIVDPFSATLEALDCSGLPVRRGASICIAVGSRGIHAIDEITKAVAGYVKSRGGCPFIIPAMGSHGGATPQGQIGILAEYGITEQSMGVPIAGDMDVVELPLEKSPFRLFMSRSAFNADGIILVNRIKPHTDFHGKYESGLVKMSVIGLGKHAQALEMHSFGVYGLRELVPEAARHILDTGKIVAGVAVVENSLEKPMLIEAMRGDAIMEREPALLEISRGSMAHLPVEKLDLLVVDYIGKDFSGTGLDTNVIGRMRIRGEREPVSPSIKMIVVGDVSERSHGNALGIGLADVITERLYKRIDFGAMYENALTSTFVERVKVPVIAGTDTLAIEYALRCLGRIKPDDVRVARIRSTLHLGELYVSENIFGELLEKGEVESSEEPRPLCAGDEFSLF